MVLWKTVVGARNFVPLQLVGWVEGTGLLPETHHSALSL